MEQLNATKWVDATLIRDMLFDNGTCASKRAASVWVAKKRQDNAFISKKENNRVFVDNESFLDYYNNKYKHRKSSSDKSRGQGSSDNRRKQPVKTDKIYSMLNEETKEILKIRVCRTQDSNVFIEAAKMLNGLSKSIYDDIFEKTERYI